MIKLFRARSGATALEFGLVFPAFLLVMFGLPAIYSLIAARRAMDFGIEKALRYAAVHGGGGAAGTLAVVNAYKTAASSIIPDVGVSSSVVVTPATFKATDTVTITVTYSWVPAPLLSSHQSTIFTGATLGSNASMRVVN